MGFLDHSTNNIIIDAVLTDEGRRLLANNMGAFQIAFFSLADDEVDYSIIEKFGRAVGKEKIAKNTPIFEAQTQAPLAMKHRLLSLADPTIVRLPTLSLTSDATNVITFNQTNGPTAKSVRLEQQIEGETRIPAGLSDTSFRVEVPNRFIIVDVPGGPTSVDPISQVATYFVGTSNSVNDSNGAIVEFIMRLQSLDNTSYSIYGNSGDKNKITGVVSVTGEQSGIRKEFTIIIRKT